MDISSRLNYQLYTTQLNSDQEELLHPSLCSPTSSPIIHTWALRTPSHDIDQCKLLKSCFPGTLRHQFCCCETLCDYSGL